LENWLANGFAGLHLPDRAADSAGELADQKVSEGRKEKKADDRFAWPGRLPTVRAFESRLPDAKRRLLSLKVASRLPTSGWGRKRDYVNLIRRPTACFVVKHPLFS
jgi:hypothetical protein